MRTLLMVGIASVARLVLAVSPDTHSITIAMAGLAQIKLDTHVADDPTILALFDKSPQAASAGLTEWDQPFLKSVCETKQKSTLQRSQMAHVMVSHFTPP